MTKLEKEHWFNQKVTARMNVNYHSNASKFYYGLHLKLIVFSIIFSSTTFISLLGVIPWYVFFGVEYIPTLLAFLVTCAGVISAIYDLQGKASLHERLNKRWLKVFRGLEALEKRSADPMAIDELARLDSEIDEINNDEPPVNSRMLKKAYIEACGNLGIRPKKR